MEEYKKVTISFTKDQLEKMDEIMSKEHGYTRSSLVREARSKGKHQLFVSDHQSEYQVGAQ